MYRCVICKATVDPATAVAGVAVYVCAECIVLGLAIIADQAPDTLRQAWQKHGHEVDVSVVGLANVGSSSAPSRSLP